MPAEPSCPDSRALEQFVLGAMAADEQVKLSQHVEQCPACVATLHGLKAEDTVLDSMRRAAERAPKFQGEVVEQLAEKMSELSAAQSQSEHQEQGSRNAFAINGPYWTDGRSGAIAGIKAQRFATSLADWRAAFNSDHDSVELEPIVYDPLQWKLLPESPGYKQRSDGKDYGAEVTRIGTIAVERP